MRPFLASIAVTASALVACGNDDLDVAPDVDLDRFQGTWHEIAHLPRPSQKDCSATLATYTRQGDGQVSVVHECTLGDGQYFGKTAIAKVRDPEAPAKLAIDFGGGHVGDYWILEVAPDYRYAVVGHPSRNYLWVLSRSEAMDPSDLTAALEHAKESGFDTRRLEFTPKGPAPKGTPAPAVTYGCSLGVTSRASAPFALGAAAIVGILVRRRRRHPSA